MWNSKALSSNMNREPQTVNTVVSTTPNREATSLGILGCRFLILAFHRSTWLIVLLGLVKTLVLQVKAQARESADYRVVAESTDSGGERTVGSPYQNIGSLGGIVGRVEGIAQVSTMRNGFLGQITERVALRLGPEPAVIDEESTQSLSAVVVLDDGSMTRLNPTDLNWEVIDGDVVRHFLC